jgi:AAA+ superfamily predicted ATPase
MSAMNKQDVEEIGFLIKSRYPIIVIETAEEPRVLDLLENASNLLDQAVYLWSLTRGLRRQTGRDQVAQTNNFEDALRHIHGSPHNAVYAMLDPHSFLEDPLCLRYLREIALEYTKVPRTLVLVGPRIDLPAELQRMSTSFRLSLPSAADIRKIFKEEVELWTAYNDGNKPSGTQEVAELLVQHLVGMYRDDARRVIRQSLQDDGCIDMNDVARALRQKHHSLESDGTLVLQTDVEKFEAVGGQERLKRWIEKRHEAFVGDAEQLGLDTPKGILLLGVQGGGKSLAAKALAGSWGLPLLRLDFGALYNKFHGETERNLRSALETAAVMSPCVLWLDEIEKGLATGGGDGDGGVSRRVLGTLLTWMSERKSRVFMVATANDISRLPPELLRKGRFDEIFFVDLPVAKVRERIFSIHLAKRKRDPATFDLAALAQASEGFSGAEIEQAVVASLYEAHALKQPLATKLILDELGSTRPLSVMRAEEIADLREWAAERTVMVD